MRTLVVLPTYNEADNIAEVLWRLRATVPAADILVVDDASPDGTAEIARARGAELGGIDVLMRAGKLGLGSAYRDGFMEGLSRGYQLLVEMDADLSHDGAALPRLLSAIDHGADLVVGSRYIAGGSIPRWSIASVPGRRPDGDGRAGQRGLAAALSWPLAKAWRASAWPARGMMSAPCSGSECQLPSVTRNVSSRRSWRSRPDRPALAAAPSVSRSLTVS